MNATSLILAVAIGLTTAMVVFVFMPMATKSLLELRLQGVGIVDVTPFLDPAQAALQRPLSERVVAPILHSIGGFILRRTKSGQLRSLRLTLLRAGSVQRAETVLAVRVILLPVGAVLGVLFVRFAELQGALAVGIPVALAGLCYTYPMSTLRGKLRKRTRAIRAALPDTLDLLTICMEAGLSLDMAIVRVTEADDGILGQEFQKTMNEVRLGRPRADAMVAMAERNDVEELSAFVRAVVQSEPLGVSVAHVLRIQSEELRRLRRQRAEAAGHRAPVLMLLPMMGCIFPCIFVVLLGPAVLSIVTSH